MALDFVLALVLDSGQPGNRFWDLRKAKEVLEEYAIREELAELELEELKPSYPRPQSQKNNYFSKNQNPFNPAIRIPAPHVRGDRFKRVPDKSQAKRAKIRRHYT